MVCTGLPKKKRIHITRHMGRQWWQYKVIQIAIEMIQPLYYFSETYRAHALLKYIAASIRKLPAAYYRTLHWPTPANAALNRPCIKHITRYPKSHAYTWDAQRNIPSTTEVAQSYRPSLASQNFIWCFTVAKAKQAKPHKTTKPIQLISHHKLHTLNHLDPSSPHHCHRKFRILM